MPLPHPRRRRACPRRLTRSWALLANLNWSQERWRGGADWPEVVGLSTSRPLFQSVRAGMKFAFGFPVRLPSHLRRSKQRFHGPVLDSTSSTARS